jgi:trk system potassium uptake protein
MDVAIVGAGEVGYHLADILSREGHRVSVVDPDPAKSRRIMESLDVQVVPGDGTRADVLSRAGVATCDLVIAVSDVDLVNMFACVVSRALGARRVILRLKETRILEEHHYLYKQIVGFDVVLSTQELAALEIAATVREHHALEVESFAGGRVQVRRIRIPERSELLGKPLAELGLPPGVLIGGVARKEGYLVPSGIDRLVSGDQIYLIGTREDLDAFERMGGAPQLTTRSIVIMGAGSLGRQVAEKLVDLPGVHVRVIERDRQRARALAAEGLREVLVLEGDATDIDLLLEERVGEANVFIATSNDDERNMVACQLARSLGVQRTVAMVNKSSYRQIYDLLGIDQAISPRILCANRILRFVRASSVHSIAVLGEGKAEVLEVVARLPQRKGSIKIQALGLPKGTVIGAIVRAEGVIVPHGETTLRDGDHVIVFTLAEKVDRVLAALGAEDRE